MPTSPFPRIHGSARTILWFFDTTQRARYDFGTLQRRLKLQRKTIVKSVLDLRKAGCVVKLGRSEVIEITAKGVRVAEFVAASVSSTDGRTRRRKASIESALNSQEGCREDAASTV